MHGNASARNSTLVGADGMLLGGELALWLGRSNDDVEHPLKLWHGGIMRSYEFESA